MHGLRNTDDLLSQPGVLPQYSPASSLSGTGQGGGPVGLIIGSSLCCQMLLCDVRPRTQRVY